MAKNTEKKFRVVRLGISPEAFMNLEAYAKFAKISRSRVITELLEYVDCPLAFLNILQTNIERRVHQKQLESGLSALDIRRQKPEGVDREKSALLISLEAKLDAWTNDKVVFERLRDALADMPDDDFEKKQNLARLKGLDSHIEMAEVLRQEEIENLEFS